MADCNKQIKHRAVKNREKRSSSHQGIPWPKDRKLRVLLDISWNGGGKVGVGCMFHDPGEAKSFNLVL